jgi:hypothetical protein
MGYRGLLLNDPYKIDRMGCVCGYSSFCIFFVLNYSFGLAIGTREILDKMDLKCG